MGYTGSSINKKWVSFMEYLEAWVADSDSGEVGDFMLSATFVDVDMRSIFFTGDKTVRVSVEAFARVDESPVCSELTERVAACINSCLGVPTDLVEQNTLSDLLAIRHQRDELLALAVRAEFELATCADRGAGDVDHGLLPDLRAMIAKIKGDGHG